MYSGSALIVITLDLTLPPLFQLPSLFGIIFNIKVPGNCYKQGIAVAIDSSSMI
jgi:hypothetical protein